MLWHCLRVLQWVRLWTSPAQEGFLEGEAPKKPKMRPADCMGGWAPGEVPEFTAGSKPGVNMEPVWAALPVPRACVHVAFYPLHGRFITRWKTTRTGEDLRVGDGWKMT